MIEALSILAVAVLFVLYGLGPGGPSTLPRCKGCVHPDSADCDRRSPDGRAGPVTACPRRTRFGEEGS